MPAGEKTESATPRRRQEMRGRGEVARSREVSAAAGLIGALLALRLGAGSMVKHFHEFMTQICGQAAVLELGPAELQTQFIGAMLATVKIVGPVLFAAAVGAVVGGASQDVF